MNEKKLDAAIKSFVRNKKANAAYYDENWTERNERKLYYQSFTKEKLIAMTEEEFFEYMSRLWSMVMWGNKRFVVDKLLADNGFETLKKQLAELLYGATQFDVRWNVFLKNVKGMGPSTISELLTYVNPREYILFNKTTILCYSYLDIPDMPKYNYQYTGKKFAEVCAIAKKIAEALKKAGAKDYDLLAVDYFLWDEILPLAEKKQPESQIAEPIVPKTESDTKSLHEEIKEKLVDIVSTNSFEEFVMGKNPEPYVRIASDERCSACFRAIHRERYRNEEFAAKIYDVVLGDNPVEKEFKFEDYVFNREMRDRLLRYISQLTIDFGLHYRETMR